MPATYWCIKCNAANGAHTNACPSNLRLGKRTFLAGVSQIDAETSSREDCEPRRKRRKTAEFVTVALRAILKK
ncbi:hypothetical protein AAE478_000597 [Parahypoxylon ruwenzoriense]